jgi:hypothetical protein
LRGALRVLLAVAGCCAMAVLAACAPGAASSRPSASPDYPPVPAASTSGDPVVLARQAYLGMWQAFVAASRTADYQSPALDRYAAGAALTLLTRGLYQDYKAGIVTRGQPTFDPVASLTGTTKGRPAEVKVTDCANDTHAITYYKSGRPAPGEPPGRHEVYARVQPFDGVWKVTYLVVEKAGTCG